MKTGSGKEAHEVHSLIRDLLRHIPDGMFIKDKKGAFIWVNDAYAQSWDKKPADFTGKSNYDLFPRQRARRMNSDDQQVLKKGESLIDKIEKVRRPDKAEGFVSLTSVPRRDHAGRIIGLMGIVRDVTHRIQLERLRAERERDRRKIGVLEGIARMKSEFISVLSHELRTPLAVAKQSLALIVSGMKAPLPRARSQILKRAERSLNRLEKITEGLLDLSRMQRGTFKLDYSLVNLKDLMKDIGDGFKELAKEKGVTVKMNLPDQTANIFIDTERVNQVLSNLLDNALKFTPKGGGIRIELVMLENKVRIGVIDTGVGISSRDLPRIFRKLVQATQGRPRSLRYKGMGLGLAISKELVERHGGEIWVESELKKGSAFYCTFPRFYSGNMLDSGTREKINQLLQQDVTLHLINLLVINYAGFRKLLKVKQKQLLAQLQGIVEQTIREFRRFKKPKQSDIYLTDFRKGECTIIFTEGKDADVSFLCGCLKKTIDDYLKARNFEDVFINIGVLEFLYRAKPLASGVVPASIYIKKIFIGAEKRRQTRYNFQMPIEPFALESCLGSSYTLDVSQKGLCFICSQQLKTNTPLTVKLVLPGSKRTLSVRGRVAWIAPIEKLHDDEEARYKTGVEFEVLKETDQKALSQFIQSVRKKHKKKKRS